MKIPISIKWVEGKNQWHMMHCDDDETFIQEFYGCELFHKLFKGISKEKQKLFIVDIQPFNKINTQFTDNVDIQLFDEMED